MKKFITSIAALAVAGSALGVPGVAQAGDPVLTHSSEGKTFYPFLVDGYKDKFHADVEIDDLFYDGLCSGDGASWTGTIYNEAGQAVYEETFAEDYSYTVAWDGSKSGGGKVLPGGYFDMVITGSFNCSDYMGTVVPFTATTTITGIHPIRGFRTIRRTIRRHGRYATSHGTTGYCLSTPQGYGWSLNCAGTPGSAWVTYRVKLPNGAAGWTGWAFENYREGPVHHRTWASGGRYRTFQAKVGGYSWADATTPVEFQYKIRRPA